MKLKKNNSFIKEAGKEIRNQNNKDHIEKYNTINLNGRMKLKTNKILKKIVKKKKIRSQKNED